MKKHEQRWGYDALEDLKTLVQFGGFEVYDAQDYRAYKLDDIPGRNSSKGKGTVQPSGALQIGNGSSSGTGRGRPVNNGNVQNSIDESTLPDDDFLREEIEA